MLVKRMEKPSNLQLATEFAEPEDLSSAYLELRREIGSAAERLTDVIAALRIGRLIDAHEAVLDIRLDLRAALNLCP